MADAGVQMASNLYDALVLKQYSPERLEKILETYSNRDLIEKYLNGEFKTSTIPIYIAMFRTEMKKGEINK